MSRIIKIVLLLVAGLVGLVVIAAVALALFFNPNDYREEISASVKDATGRDLVIEGDLSLSVFPWLAIDVGKSTLGNAEGFSDEPFLSFDEARLSVRIMPVILSQKVTVGTASLSGLNVNLEVAESGRTNWDDFSEVEEQEQSGVEVTVEASVDPVDISVSSIVVADANLSYRDAQAGSAYSLTNLNFETGGIGANEPIDIDAAFNFSAAPDDISGNIAIRGTALMSDGGAQLTVSDFNVSGQVEGIVSEPTEFNFDSREVNVNTEAQSANLGEMDLTILGLSVSADVEPFSYAGSPQPKAQIRVAEFSLKELMQKLDIEAPATADPDAMSRVSFEGNAAIGERDIALSNLILNLDDSALTGELSVPTAANGALTFDLVVDAINLDAYMAPAEEGMVDDSSDDAEIEIPVDMIRTLNANGTFRIERALFSGLEFTNMQLGLNSADGRLRLNPLGADLYDGKYSGDVRIDAATDTPSISVNEHLTGVNLATLAKSLYDQDNISGEINGSFVLSGAGKDVAAIRSDLDGTMSMELVDGAWEGTDVWHQIRAARALFKQEPAPEPQLPARTEFSSVKATGTVTNGLFENDDLLIELPFLQLTGAGRVDLNAAEVDYSVNARVLQKPELMASMTQEEIDDFTETVIPIKITGPLSSPRMAPDIEGIFRQQVEDAIQEETDRLKNRLFDSLLGGDEDENTDESAEEEEPEKELQNLLENLIGN